MYLGQLNVVCICLIACLEYITFRVYKHAICVTKKPQLIPRLILAGRENKYESIWHGWKLKPYLYQYRNNILKILKDKFPSSFVEIIVRVLTKLQTKGIRHIFQNLKEPVYHRVWAPYPGNWTLYYFLVGLPPADWLPQFPSEQPMSTCCSHPLVYTCS